MYKFVIVLFGFVAVSSGQYVSSGQCQNNLGTGNFSLSGYAGTSSWFPVQTSSRTADCMVTNFTVTNATTLHMVFTQRNLTTGVISSTHGEVYWDGAARREGYLRLVYPNSTPQIFQIASIDYTGYTIDYRCVNVNSTAKTEYLWVMTRTRQFASGQQQLVDSLLQRFGFDDIPTFFPRLDEQTCS